VRHTIELDESREALVELARKMIGAKSTREALNVLIRRGLDTMTKDGWIDPSVVGKGERRG
jgi:hypothetical protein